MKTYTFAHMSHKQYIIIAHDTVIRICYPRETNEWIHSTTAIGAETFMAWIASGYLFEHELPKQEGLLEMVQEQLDLKIASELLSEEPSTYANLPF
jgi:hypothetical protein